MKLTRQEFVLFLELIEDREFIRSMFDLYWEIEAEHRETGERFQKIRDRRLRELGIVQNTPQWYAAIHCIEDAESDHAICHAEAWDDMDLDYFEKFEMERLAAAKARLASRA